VNFTRVQAATRTLSEFWPKLLEIDQDNLLMKLN